MVGAQGLEPRTSCVCEEEGLAPFVPRIPSVFPTFQQLRPPAWSRFPKPFVCFRWSFDTVLIRSRSRWRSTRALAVVMAKHREWFPAQRSNTSSVSARAEFSRAADPAIQGIQSSENPGTHAGVATKRYGANGVCASNCAVEMTGWPQTEKSRSFVQMVTSRWRARASRSTSSGSRCAIRRSASCR